MRTIKFRGKVKHINSAICPEDGWVEGYYLKDLTHGEMRDYIFNCPYWYEVLPETVGQFIGITDKNGIEIYEDDIVRVKQIGGYGMQYIGVVRYYDKDCRFGIDTTKTCSFTKRELFTDGECSDQDGHCTRVYTNTYEVIGNIHDMTWIKIDRVESGFATEEHLRKIEECYANNNTVVIAYENYLQDYNVITPCSRINAWLDIIKREKVYTHYMVLPKAIKARRKKE